MGWIVGLASLVIVAVVLAVVLRRSHRRGRSVPERPESPPERRPFYMGQTDTQEHRLRQFFGQD